ncbi:protein-arginine deiminase family protein [Streptomyces litchfieldiae]|uniref:Protein-arginine deiminase family protein n=1 Tax=Streptomyces litchfieldiae TaxID=3075543 RepID=A0ABU2MRC7_9ACTN|nr:protein-arginine deiminase family protein [Streptomyces sp. DSM 44938]MDT0343649.1 protein-arginine deiminase family protein [Streptomyces sp. DSM 44938]
MSQATTSRRIPRRRPLAVAAAATATAAVAGIAVVQLSGAGAATPPGATLFADTNRDGRLNGGDMRGRSAWTDDRGALVMPNLDDSAGRCPTLAEDGSRLTDDELAACHDASDERVNGPLDALDLAPLRVAALPRAGSDAFATITVNAAAAPHVRLFLHRHGEYTPLGPDTRLTGEQLRSGVRLALEARDLVRDPAEWDGLIDVTLEVVDGDRTSGDTARLRVAPLILTHDLLPIDRMVISDNGTTPEDAERHGYDPEVPARPVEDGEEVFRAELGAALAGAGLNDDLLEYPTGGDRWMRDQFITGYFAVPGPDGTAHRMRVLLRSADVMPEGSSADFPLRDAGRSAFTVLRGPGTAVLQQYDADRVGDDEHSALWGSFSSTGNFLVAPPDERFPAGRVLYGSNLELAAPDATFTRLLQAQHEQEPLAVDTSWLAVGHIDEFLSFVPAGTERGWAAVVADPELGRDLLTEAGADALLDDERLTAGTRLAAAGIDRALELLTRELGLSAEDIVRVPALFTRLDVPGHPRQDIVANHLPAVANGVATGTRTFLAPVPHAPADATGEDVFQRAAEEALAAVGVRVAWVEEWDYAHAVGTVGGEIHCVTNALRDLSAARPWWRSPGRS